MKKILALHTGGTISMSASNGEVHTNEENPLLDSQFINDNIELTNEVILNKPSEHITPEDMLVIKKKLQEVEREGIYDGIVVTHGTDTLEETAYFLDLTVPNKIPIVVTGAMRSSNELGSDGVYNFQSAVLTAASDEAADKGVLVVMNDEIHTARYVTKTHTTNVNTFRTPTFGPIGMVYKRDIRFFQALIKQQACDIQSLKDGVYLVKAYAGMPAIIFEALNRPDTKGVVIEGLGAGNLPVEVVEPIQVLIDRDVPVVMVSRCYNGVAEPIYDYIGGGIDLERMGVIFCQGLNGPKARLKLQIAVSGNMSDEHLAKYMQDAVS
ncbi:asparaginase [Pediococcus argentinicus]|uniref:L-asparaginase n=1 Tax=Pediococcus argentinicus TaxID=480391 RepID=A0A0R2NHP4_9LACO|nr:asparaginase [Pediococcus argentinicus]KRO25327.1 hypothetical protein IV88_GL000272 [Pediococcus argentinicus]NKZ22066.1 asparaginase [Pediococcus argentinicus]GEP19405.1 L-asparaginase [Pediococcus argentinicus]